MKVKVEICEFLSDSLELASLIWDLDLLMQYLPLCQVGIFNAVICLN